jgi:Uma2 family endonuclease
MSASLRRNPISVDEYLTSEVASSVKREYLGGAVYAIADVRNAHNVISSNVLGSLNARLRGQRCRAYNSDTRIRIRSPMHTCF